MFELKMDVDFSLIRMNASGDSLFISGNVNCPSEKESVVGCNIILNDGKMPNYSVISRWKTDEKGEFKIELKLTQSSFLRFSATAFAPTEYNLSEFLRKVKK
jgi:hypothetical protein